MKVNVVGIGPVNFPDSMSEEEIRKVLKQFEPKKDDTVERLLKSLVEALQKPQIVKDSVPVEIEKQVIIEKPTVQTVEIPGKAEKTAWHFHINREDGLITEIYAEPV